MVTVGLEMTIFKVTEKAVYITDGEKGGWVAKSLIEDYEEEWKMGETREMEIPVWLAEEMGWI